MRRTAGLLQSMRIGFQELLAVKQATCYELKGSEHQTNKHGKHTTQTRHGKIQNGTLKNNSPKYRTYVPNHSRKVVQKGRSPQRCDDLLDIKSKACKAHCFGDPFLVRLPEKKRDMGNPKNSAHIRAQQTVVSYFVSLVDPGERPPMGPKGSTANRCYGYS